MTRVSSPSSPELPTAQRLVFLGPQRRDPTVEATLRSLDVDPNAPVAICSAGWEERERELEEFEQHIRSRAVNLDVFHHVEEIYENDNEFREVVLERHARMHALQRLYRGRLSHALDSARELLAQEGEEWLLEPERVAAIEEVRSIDAHYLERVRQLHDEFRDRHKPRAHPRVAKYREQVERQLGECSALCVAGGNVMTLLNRIRMAHVLHLWDPAKPIVAWGAGAMVLSDRVVLFHDSPPQGGGNAEILEPGLGIAPGIVPLPHASHRLALDDRTRVRLFAERFGPARCVALDPGARADWNGREWTLAEGTQWLAEDGALEPVLTGPEITESEAGEEGDR